MSRQSGRLIELQLLVGAAFMFVVIFVATLLAAGADREAKNHRGQTPRALAQESGVAAVIAALDGKVG